MIRPMKAQALEENCWEIIKENAMITLEKKETRQGFEFQHMKGQVQKGGNQGDED